MSPNSINQQTVTTNETTRNYSNNIITNDNASVPLSSTPPPISPTTGRNIAIDEQNFPRLPSPPTGVYD